MGAQGWRNRCLASMTLSHCPGRTRIRILAITMDFHVTSGHCLAQEVLVSADNSIVRIYKVELHRLVEKIRTH